MNTWLKAKTGKNVVIQWSKWPVVVTTIGKKTPHICPFNNWRINKFAVL